MAQVFLNQAQVKKLGEHNWDNIKPNGASFVFYPDDFKNKSVWEELCERFELPTEAESITLLAVASTIQ